MMRAFLTSLLFCCILPAADPSVPVDPRRLGAKCDANYDASTKRISGTDDTAAFVAALQSISSRGGTVRIPGLCRITSGLVVTRNMVALVGYGGFLHSNSQTPSSGIIFDAPAGVAVTVQGGGFRMQDTSVLTRRGASVAIVVAGGNSVFENVKVFGTEGACPGCIPREADGTGIRFRGVQSNVDILHSQIAGYYVGIDAESTAALTIQGRSQFMSNDISIRIGRVHPAAQVTIQDADLQDAVTGNIDIVGAEAVTVSHNYFEIGSHQRPFNVRIGRDAGTMPTSISYRGNYLHCNDNAQTPAIILNAVRGWTQEDNTFNSCPGVIVSNDGSATSGLRFANDTFLGHPPQTYLTTNRGVVSRLESHGGMYFSSLRDSEDALHTGTGGLNLNGACRVYTGAGDPNGLQLGEPCDLYLNSKGGVGTVLWVKETGSGTKTGWVSK